MIFKITMLFAIIATASALNSVAYTKVSHTINREPCLSDCMNDICYTDYRLNTDKCVSEDEPAPTYHTAQAKTPDKTTCLSRCAKYGYNYEWCFVSEDYSWDYCSSELQTRLVTNYFQTLYSVPCADSCKEDGMCTDFYGTKRDCNDKKKETYVQANNVYGEKCNGICHKHSNAVNKYYWCYDSNRDSQYCAPPAEPPALKEFSKNLTSIECVQGVLKNKRCTKNKEEGLVAKTACKMAELKYFKTVSVNELRNPIYSYTVKPPKNSIEPELPLVVRAKITIDTLRPAGHFEKNGNLPTDVIKNVDLIAQLPEDKPSNLIGYQIGGPVKIYNIIPLRRSVRNGFKKIEADIFHWINSKNATSDANVDITLVVIYKNTARPYAVGVDIVYKNGNEVVNTIRDEILANIDPEQESFIRESAKKTTTQRPEVPPEEMDFGLWR